jgi:hypothetical protein
MPQHALSIRSLVDTDDELGVRRETFLGREWLVVPTVCLVEGVVQGMNAKVPELALSEEFGKVVEGWNGRPVVMNHPVIDGDAVSANSPKAYEQYAFGVLFNSRVEDKKLKADAWIDLDRVKVLGGEFETTVQRIEDNTIVEVSTGLFTGIEETKGRFNGKDYGAVWRDVMPDHLAFLSEGTIGACSIEDGCGTPRANAGNLKVHASATRWLSCGCTHPATTEATVPDVTPTPVVVESTTTPTTEVTIKPNAAGEIPSFDFTRFSTNSYPSSMMDQDARKLVAEALRATMGRNNYTYIIGLTQDKVVYETWDYNGDSYSSFQRSFSIGEDKAVTLGDDAEKVVVTMTVTPVQNSTATSVKANSGDPEMPDTPAAPVTPETTTTAPVATTETPAPAPAPAVQAAPAPVARPTIAQFLEAAPPELAAVINQGLSVLKEKKDSIIKGLQSTNRCKFTVEQLNAMDVTVLEQLAELASIPSYQGQNPAPREITDNEAIPSMPPLIIPAA